MGYSLAIGPTQLQFPQSRAVVQQTTRHSPRVEEILGTARVIRQDEHAAKLQSRANRRDGGDLTSDNTDPDKARALAIHGGHDPIQLTLGQLSAAGASTAFVAQVLGQANAPSQESDLLHHRDGAAITSVAYRRAGGAPALYSSEAALVRLAV